MNNSAKLETFCPHPPDAAGVVSWAHIGDLHMRDAAGQNYRDLQSIVQEINAVFADTISFVYLPGDNADHGDAPAYGLVRGALDGLNAPWCAIVGDHDVEQRSFDGIQASLAEKTHYAFTVDGIRFIALNAFDVPEPPSFTVLPEQLLWLETQLQQATAAGQVPVLLMHCYPSDLKVGGAEVSRLIATFGVRVVDMGHTHYNEISSDGKAIYTATRSTGQIEEGNVGFSVTNLDGGVVSWRFLELGALPAVMITSPSDERLLADDAELGSSDHPALRVRAKIWTESDISHVEAIFEGNTQAMRQINGSNVWETTFPPQPISSGVYPLRVKATDAHGNAAGDAIRVLVGGNRPTRSRAARDQDNALDAWPEHGLLGTQLGPNKNGRKW